MCVYMYICIYKTFPCTGCKTFSLEGATLGGNRAARVRIRAIAIHDPRLVALIAYTSLALNNLHNTFIVQRLTPDS